MLRHQARLWGLLLLSIVTANGQFTAAPGSPYAVGASPQSVAVADVNGDGKPDVIVANSGANTVSVLLGNGSGGFSAAPGSPFAAGMNPQSVAVADFNGDGKPDIVVANSGGGNVTVLLGAGTGKFTAASGSPFAVGTSPMSVAAGDFNGDGKADIAVANSGDGTVTVLLGNGAGGFTAASGGPFSAGTSPQALAVSDFNGDGKQDLVVANLNAGTVTVLLGNGSGGFVTAANSPFAVGSVPSSVAVRDMNGDGKPDLVVANSGDSTVTLLLGDGTGGFLPAAGSPFAAGTNSSSVATADFNGDGFPDIVTANSGSGNLTLLLSDTMGGFAAAKGSPFAVGALPVSVAAADLNGDGRADIVAVNSSDATVTVYLNTLPALTANRAALAFYSGIQSAATAPIPVSLTSSTSGSTYTVTSNQTWLVPTPASNATGGATTVNVTANPASLGAGVYTGTVRYTAPGWFDAATAVTFSVAGASGTLQPASGSPFAVGAGPQSIATADFNGDGNLDIVTANYADSTVSLLLGNGSGGFTAASGGPFATGNSPNAIALGDVNGDGKLDIVTANSGSNNVTVLLGDGAGGFSQAPGSPFAAGKEPLSVALGDFNADGNLDVAIANNVDKDVTILLGDVAGGFTQASGSPVNLGTAPQSVTAGDFNGDGIPDLAVSAFNNHVTILIGNGYGGFTVKTSIPVGSFPQIVAAADLNADGKLDLVTVNFGNNNVSVLLGDGSGNFTAVAGSPFAVGMQPQSFAVADVNGDGRPDIISANTGDNTVTILLGNGSGGFTAAPGSPFAAGAAPYAAAVGDFNGDGVPDIAAADVVGTVTLLLGGPVATVSALTTTASSPVVYGAAIPLTLKVASGGFNAPTGTATFLDGSVALGSSAQQTSPYTFNATGLTPGVHTFAASYAGDAANLASSAPSLSVTITAAAQTITFGALANKTFGAAPFTVSATASSGLPVAFASTSTAVCSLSGATLTLVAVGTCTIQATQPGDSNYAAATPVNQHFTVAQGSQTITFAALPNQQIGTPPLTLTATASSGLAVSFTATPATVCTVSGTTLTLVAAGTCTVQATQAGDANYTAAPAVSQHFTVTPTGQTITFGALSDQVFGASPIALAATSTSGLAVTFTSSTAPVCMVSGSMVTLVSVGTCIIQAAQAGNASFAAASPVTQSFKVNQGSQIITFAALPDKPVNTPHFTVTATASSGLAVAFVSTTAPVCMMSSGSVTLVSVGTCTVEAQQAGNANYAAATPVEQSFNVTPGSQTITFAALANKAFGSAAFTVSATASSMLPVGFASTTSSVCTVSGASVTLVSVGTCTVEASQAGNASYAAATPADQSFNVTQGSQTITFGALSSQPFGTPPITVSATASSGLPVSFASSPAAVCTNAGAVVTLVSVGTCTIQATQAGNANYAAAPAVSQKFSVTQASQTITFAPLQSQVFGAPPITVTATASSGLTVAFTSTTPSVCTISGATVTLVSGGTCTIQASQPGNTGYAAAPSVNQSFTVSPEPQTITFGALAGRTLGPPFTVAATASSGLAVSFSATTSAICTVSGATVTLVSVGTCTVQAAQAGNSSYAAATPVNQSFAVTSPTQTINFGALANKPFGTMPSALTAAATSGLPVSFASLTSSVCTVSASNVTLVTVGTCTIEASQAGNASWPAATPVDQSFMVTPGSQTISFAALTSQPFGAAPFSVTASASSSLAVSFASTTSSVCTVSGSTVTLVSVGTCTVEASQPGNTNYNAATPVDQSFSVTQGTQTITFAALSSQPYGTAPIALTATASSGLPVSYTATPAAVCTVATAVLTLIGVGNCTVQAAQPGNANYAAAPSVSQKFAVTQATQAITIGPIQTQTFGAAPITVTATSTSGLAVTLTSTTPSVCTVSGTTVTLVSAGTCTLQATQAGNANFAAAPSVSQSFTVSPATQTITFGALASQPLGQVLMVSATASSGLPVSFASTTSAVCTVSGSTVTPVSLGTCTVEASQAGNSSYSAAAPVDQSFPVTSPTQTITFGALTNIPFANTPVALSATATSNLPVSFASLTPMVCTVSGTSLNMITVGICTVEASQAGNMNWPPAKPVDQSFPITFGTQTITFAALANQPYGTAPFPLSATASSGLTVSFASTTGSVCTVSGSTVTLVNIGTCAITALQTGNANYSNAPPVTQSFMVSQGSQTISFSALSNQVFGTAVSVGASASSGLPVAFSASPATVCTITGASVNLTGVGTCIITATQPGNNQYSAATPVPQSFMVTQGTQNIVMSVLSNQGFTIAPVPVSAIASSGLPVQLASTTPSVCTVSNSAVTLLGLGTCTITATQSGNANYAAAATVTQSFTIAQGAQTILFPAPANQPAGAAPIMVSAMASSGLPVGVVSTTPAVCGVAGATVTLLKAGVCTLQATQPGNALFAAAIPVSESFTVGTPMTIGSILNAASYAALPVASGAYTVAFGNNLSTGVAQTTSTNLPGSLAGTTVAITDSAGQTLTSLLYYVSPTQINFLVPDGLAAGKATVTVSGTNSVGTFPVTVAQVSPALFTADASGTGVPAAITLEGAAQGPPVFSCGGNPISCVAVPINLGPPSTKVYLVLFGTGIRGRSSLSGVTVTLGGINLEVDYAGAQGTYPGLDQVNVLLDRSLIGQGQLTLQLTVDGVSANPVTVNVM